APTRSTPAGASPTRSSTTGKSRTGPPSCRPTPPGRRGRPRRTISSPGTASDGEGYRRRGMLRLVADGPGLLGRAREGEADAKAALIARVYSELRALAASYFRGRPGQTLQPTALVHEAYVRLTRADASQWKDRSHFMAVAATAMRQILTDKARRRSASKRGGPKKERVTLSNLPAFESPVDVV